MLKKLLKYDIRGMAKSLAPFYGLVILLGTLVRLFGIVEKHFPVIEVISTTILAFFIISLTAIVFYTFFVTIRRFYRTVLKDEGYLTNTLPVKKSNIILSQLITAILSIIASVAIAIISLLIAFYTKGMIKEVIDSINQAIALSGVDAWVSYLYVLIILFINYITYVLTFFLALILGHQKSQNKIAHSFSYGIIIYIVMQLIAAMGIGIVSVFDNNIIEIANKNNATFYEMIPIFISAIITSLISIIIEYLLSCKFINNKLNLE